jgi:hypothetical protein
MTSSEKLVEFIKADWLAKKRAFDAAVTFPVLRMPPTAQVVPIPPQLPLPFIPSPEPVAPVPRKP